MKTIRVSRFVSSRRIHFTGFPLKTLRNCLSCVFEFVWAQEYVCYIFSGRIKGQFSENRTHEESVHMYNESHYAFFSYHNNRLPVGTVSTALGVRAHPFQGRRPKTLFECLLYTLFPPIDNRCDDVKASHIRLTGRSHMAEVDNFPISTCVVCECVHDMCIKITNNFRK